MSKEQKDTTKAFRGYGGDDQVGMDLRDYFAAKALQGLYSDRTTILSVISSAKDTKMTAEEQVAKLAYNQADSMMKQRKL